MIEVGAIPKPLYGTPCNGCGICCLTPCPTIQILHPGEHVYGTPCPRLRERNGRFECGLFTEEEDPLRKEFIEMTTGCKFLLGM